MFCCSTLYAAMIIRYLSTPNRSLACTKGAKPLHTLCDIAHIDWQICKIPTRNSSKASCNSTNNSSTEAMSPFCKQCKHIVCNKKVDNWQELNCETIDRFILVVKTWHVYIVQVPYDATYWVPENRIAILVPYHFIEIILNFYPCMND